MRDDVFKALSDPIRRKILEYLGERDMSAGEIWGHFNITKPSVSRHLAILKSSGLVFDARQGQKIIYSLNTPLLGEIIQWFYNTFGNVWMSR